MNKLEKDPTEAYRRERQAELNAAQATRTDLEARYGKIWSPVELCAEFHVEGFVAPFVLATRLVDNKKGTLEFQHSPRFYFNWTEA